MPLLPVLLASGGDDSVTQAVFGCVSQLTFEVNDIAYSGSSQRFSIRMLLLVALGRRRITVLAFSWCPLSTTGVNLTEFGYCWHRKSALLHKPPVYA